MADAPRRVSTLAQERWLLGEASADEQARVESLLSDAQREGLRVEDAALRSQLFTRLSPAQLTSRVRARAIEEREPRTRPAWTALVAGSVALACALLALWRPGESLPVGQRSTAEERSKGLAPSLHVYRRRGAFAEQLGPEAQLHAHDVLQLGYVAAGHKHGVLLSIDGAGQVTLHFPTDEASSTALTRRQGEQLLTSAYELDDAPGFERFFWIVAQRPLSVPALVASARRLAGEGERASRELLVLPAGTAQYSVLFRKEPP